MSAAEKLESPSLYQLLRLLQSDGDLNHRTEEFSAYARLKLVDWYSANVRDWTAEALAESGLVEAIERTYRQGLGADHAYIGELTVKYLEEYAINCCLANPAWLLLADRRTAQC